MKFEYRYYSVDLILLRLDYPSFPCKPGDRAVLVWQVQIDDNEPTIKTGSKKEIISRVKKYIRELDGDFIAEEDDEIF
jgi:hypothetical protein